MKIVAMMLICLFVLPAQAAPEAVGSPSSAQFVDVGVVTCAAQPAVSQRCAGGFRARPHDIVERVAS